MAANDFVQNLRMAGIFGRDVPFGQVSTSGGPNFEGMISDIFNNARAEKETQRQHEIDMMKMQQQGRLREIAAQAAQANQPKDPNKMNWVLGESPDAMTGFQKATLNLNKDKLAEKTSTDQGTLQMKTGDQKIKQQRANIYDFKSKNPGMKYITPKGGNVMAVNPVTGEQYDTGIDSGTLSDKDRMELQGSQNIDAIDERGKMQQDVQGMRGDQNLQAIAKNIQGKKDIAASQETKPLLPTQQKVLEANKARQLINTRPDLAPFLQPDAQGNYIIQQPSTGYFGNSGPNPEQLKAIQDSIYGTPTSTTSKSKSDSKTKPKSKYAVSVE